MTRPSPVSGFPEWLPPAQIVENHLVGALAGTFAAHGFREIQTRAVEPLEQLLRKGETSKEVYVVRRLQDADEIGYGAKTLGLRFDLTVPLARYVLENAGKLEFPFKRYQIQRVWRGERPQDGRFREFIQADVDVVGLGELPFHFDYELPLLMAQALGGLEIGQFDVRVSNRKLAEGFVKGLGCDQVGRALVWIDKLGKIGFKSVGEGLSADGFSSAQISALLEFAQISGDQSAEVVGAVERLAASYAAGNELLDCGLAELGALLEATDARQAGAVVADMKIVRGLDYYSGSVYETTWRGNEHIGSICSGGRYDSLAKDGRQTYPGVGLSIGVTRLLSQVVAQGLLGPSRRSPTVVLVAVTDESSRLRSDQIAAGLRGRGIAAEVAPTAAKFGKQIRYADRLGIPFVWFPGDHLTPDQVKDLRSGDQVSADATSWSPPQADRQIRLERPNEAEG
jgi:histidyl-tRNA synthetase